MTINPRHTTRQIHLAWVATLTAADLYREPAEIKERTGDAAAAWTVISPSSYHDLEDVDELLPT